MGKSILCTLFLLQGIMLHAQEHAWVYFIDKQQIEQSLANPENLLSRRALDRKARYAVPIDVRDIPVNQSYIDSVKARPGISVKAKSKWFNCLHILGTIADIRALEDLDFVQEIDFSDKSLNAKTKISNYDRKGNHFDKIEQVQVNYVYGSAKVQIYQLGAQSLHEANFTGEGMWVALLDAGFPQVDKMDAFSRLRSNNNLLGGYDFENRTADIFAYTGSGHGTNVLSDMAAFVENEFVGTAPDASYFLFRTEVSESETPVEMSYWVEAAERADSLGIDMINSSLGYSTFDNPAYNYSPGDMDGKTTFISKGANVATEKGILVVNSAGNSGDDLSWGIISAPADANVYAVGAVDSAGDYVSFSSRGPNAIGVIKPDGMALGRNAAVINPDDTIVQSNGTSFASPIMAGALICLWQAFPELSNLEIMQMARESSSLFSNPNSQMGYGIPNFSNSLIPGEIDDMANDDDPVPNTDTKIIIYPNPTTETLTFNLPIEISSAKLFIFGIDGKQIMAGPISTGSNKIDVGFLRTGLYVLQLQMNGNRRQLFKLLKR